MQNNRLISVGSLARKFWLVLLVASACSITIAQVPTIPAQPPAVGGAAALAPQGPGAATNTQPSESVPVNPPTAKAEEPPTDAERVIDLAIKKLAALKSVAAELLEKIDMLNQKVSIKGRYLRAEGTRVYLSLTVAGLPDTGGTTLQVCDGETLWDYEQLFESQVYRKLSIKPVLERLNSADLDPKLREQIFTQMGVSGPETLLVGLRRTLKFDQKEEGTLDGKAVWILRGTWRSRQGLLLPNASPAAATGVLPPYVPMDGTLYLGKDDGWPYKLVLLGRKPTGVIDTRRRGPDNRPIGSQRSIERIEPTRIELIYSDVKLNVPIRVEEFAFTAPSTANPEDNTQAIINQLDQALQMEAARKKAESAKKEEPLLEKSIEIPSPSPPAQTTPPPQ
jgi:outer membrane lipoprotein-sorting protein